MSLLFDINDPPVEDSQPSSQVNVIVGASVGAVCAAAIIGLIIALSVSAGFRHTVLPFTNRLDAKEFEKIDEDSPPPSAGWSNAATAQASLRNTVTDE